jgi:hypothetical protein
MVLSGPLRVQADSRLPAAPAKPDVELVQGRTKARQGLQRHHEPGGGGAGSGQVGGWARAGGDRSLQFSLGSWVREKEISNTNSASAGPQHDAVSSLPAGSRSRWKSPTPNLVDRFAGDLEGLPRRLKVGGPALGQSRRREQQHLRAKLGVITG